MNLVYFGSGAFGLPTLGQLAAEHRVAMVVTQPDRPAGRRRHLAPTPVGQYAADRSIQMIKAPQVNDPQVIQRIHAAAPDAIVVIAFGQKLRPALLGEIFAVNLHASLLPKYRGAAPVSWALINGESETGVSVITISQRIDAGDVLGHSATRIDPMETAGELEQRLADMGPSLMLKTLALHEADQLQGHPQDDEAASRAPRLSKSDGTVRFDQQARAVQGRVHGLIPWPGCTVALNGTPLKLARVAVVDDDPASVPPGRILDDHTVACAVGRVRLLDVQPPGGRTMSFEAFLRGHPAPTGTGIEPYEVQ